MNILLKSKCHFFLKSTTVPVQKAMCSPHWALYTCDLFKDSPAPPDPRMSVCVCVYRSAHAALPGAQDGPGPGSSRGSGPKRMCEQGLRSTMDRSPGWRVAEPWGFRRILPLFAGLGGRRLLPAGCSLFTGQSAARAPAEPLPSPPAICRLSAIVSSGAWRPGRHPRGPGA